MTENFLIGLVLSGVFCFFWMRSNHKWQLEQANRLRNEERQIHEQGVSELHHEHERAVSDLNRRIRELEDEIDSLRESRY